MALYIYNSLTRKKEEFVPIKKGKVGMYVCGVTVYDECHIGHLRASYVFEVIKRYLKYKGYDVKYVKNITDVDDKIIAKAREEMADVQSLKPKVQTGELKQNIQDKVKEITDRYTKRYYRDMEALGIEPADIEPRATEHIRDMVEIIIGLLQKGYAYQVDGDVYFEIKKFRDYGILSNQSLEEMRVGVRAEADQRKKDPLDFALWKASKEGEPFWDSPWGKGRPGWHIECSAMSMKYLGRNFDIHGGGLDLIFPHHENEIAQSESYTQKKFANFWIHNGLLTVNGQKMSKSLGNFITVPDILRSYHPEVLKVFFLSSHHASPIDFTFSKMDEARKARDRFYILFEKIERMTKVQSSPRKASQRGRQLKVKSQDSKVKGQKRQIDEVRKRFEEAMDDNFNTPAALACLFDLVNLTNKFIENEGIRPGEKASFLNYFRLTLLKLGQIFGLFRMEAEEMKPDAELINKLMELILELRNISRERRDFELADKIRERLSDLHIVVEDQTDGTIWRIRP